MKLCEQCEVFVFEHDTQCPECGSRVLCQVEAPAPPRMPSTLGKVLKWLFIGLALVIAAGVLAVTVILNSLGPMPSMG
ncbi:MAG TPA: hypothetical protein VJA19_09700 [Pseudomonas sp.]|nr:hypothetical protein [Pseudomonas sp.]